MYTDSTPTWKSNVSSVFYVFILYPFDGGAFFFMCIAPLEVSIIIDFSCNFFFFVF